MYALTTTASKSQNLEDIGLNIPIGKGNIYIIVASITWLHKGLKKFNVFIVLGRTLGFETDAS